MSGEEGGRSVEKREGIGRSAADSVLILTKLLRKYAQIRKRERELQLAPPKMVYGL